MSTQIKHESLVMGDDFLTAVFPVSFAADTERGNVLARKTGVPALDGTTVPLSVKQGGTGAGTITAISLITGVRAGTYSVKCTGVTGDVATFEVKNPATVSLGTFTVEKNKTATFAKEISITIANDATTPFAKDDEFEIKVKISPGDMKLYPWNPSGTGGLETPYAILAEDATSSTTHASVYIRGTFNRGKLIVAAGANLDVAFDGLRAVGIIAFYPADRMKY